MTAIELHQVKRDNSNIRRYSDLLWRALRKERFKPARPDALTNQMAAEESTRSKSTGSDFKHDMEKFMETKLKPREAEILWLFLYGGRMTQQEIADYLGVCQSTVAQTLQVVFQVVKEEYYGRV